MFQSDSMKVVYGKLTSFSHGGRIIFSDYISNNEGVFHINKKYNFFLHIYFILTKRINYTDTVVFFDNRPRIFVYSQEVHFHNALLFKENIHLMPGRISRLKGEIVRIEIRYFGLNTTFFVQSQIMKNSFLNNFGKKTCIVNKVVPEVTFDDDTLFGLFPSRDIPHKGLREGLRNLKNVQESSSVTWKKVVIFVLSHGQNYFEKNIQIIYIGPLEHKLTLAFILKVDFVFFPSLVESLGLPLYEAAVLKQIIIAKREGFVIDYLGHTNSDNVVFLDDEKSIKSIFEK